jgi:hypothetical protein
MQGGSPSLRTTNATPTTIAGAVELPPDSLCKLKLYVFASDHLGDVSIWTIDVAARRVGTGPIQLLSTTTRQNTTGAAAWAIAVDLSNLIDIRCIVTGAAGRTIDWLYTNDEPYCMDGPFLG